MMKTTVITAICVGLLSLASVTSVAQASATDPECELLAGALCSANHPEGSPAWWDCVLDFIARNCGPQASADGIHLGSLRQEANRPS